MRGSRKRREIGLRISKARGLSRSTDHCKRDGRDSTGYYGIRDTAPISAWEVGEGRGLGVGGRVAMGLKCNHAVNSGPAVPGHWGKNTVTTSLGVPSPVLIRNLGQSLLL